MYTENIRIIISSISPSKKDTILFVLQTQGHNLIYFSSAIVVLAVVELTIGGDFSSQQVLSGLGGLYLAGEKQNIFIIKFVIGSNIFIINLVITVVQQTT